MDFGSSASTNPLSFDSPLEESSLEGLGVRRELVVIDSAIAEYQTLLPGIKASAQVFVLDSAQDGIAQIGQILNGYTDLDAVHIFSHGGAGRLQLGASTLDSQNLAQYSSALQSWSNSLTADADLLFFGCNLAATSDGQVFVDQLASLTGADVAASDDLTGNAALGGDWDLEVTFGQIESSAALNEATQNNYGFTLAITPSINTTSKLISFSGNNSDDQLSIQFNDEGLFSYSFDNTNFLTDLGGQTLSGTDFVAQSYSVNVALGGGNDTLNLDASFTELLDNANATTTWNVTSTGTGTIDAGSTTSAISFSGVENLVGGISKDTFSVSNLSYITSIEGGGDIDTLNISASAVANTWTISGEDTGSVVASTGTVQFAEISDVVGSNTAQDTFVVATAGSISGTIDGGTSTNDQVTYSTYNGPVGVNLGLNSATGLGEFSSIESFVGSTANLNGSANLDDAAPPTQVEIGDRIQVNGKYYDAVAAIEPDSGLDYDYDATSDTPSTILQGDRVLSTDGVSIYQAVAVQDAGSGTINLSTENFSNATNWSKITVDLSDDTQDYANNTNWSEVTSTVIGADAISTTWTISGNDAFSVDGLSFTDFGNIAGGRGDDTFNFSDGASLSGLIDGDANGYYDYTVESKPDEALAIGDRVVLNDGSIYEAATAINLPAGTGASYTTSNAPASIAIGDRVTVGSKIYAAVVAISPESPATTIDLSEATQLYASNETWEPVTIDLSLSAQNYNSSGNWNLVPTSSGDTISFSALIAGIVVDLDTSTVSNNTGTLTGFANIEKVIGTNQTTDEITGSNNDTTWNITGANSGNVDTLNFQAIENLTGSASGNDWFVFDSRTDGSLSGAIDGGTGGKDTFAAIQADGTTTFFSGDSTNPVDQSGTEASWSTAGLNVTYANLDYLSLLDNSSGKNSIEGTGVNDEVVIRYNGTV
jgi:hypothetical protein